jgi:hypothetical protein
MRFRFPSKQPHLRVSAPEPDQEAWRRDAARLMEIAGFEKQPDRTYRQSETHNAS